MQPAHPIRSELILGFVLILLVLLRWQMTPVITDVRYTLGESQEVTSEEKGIPFGFDRRDDLLTVSFTLSYRSWIRPSLFTVQADDCLGSMTVNGQPVSPDIIGPCDIDTAKDMRLGPSFSLDSNEVIAVIPDTGGWQGFRMMKVSNKDPLFLIVRLLTALVFVLLSVVLILHRLKTTEKRCLAMLFVLGVLLRLLYFEVTPFTVRSYDAEGHLDYVRYMSEHFSIPLIRDGWQYYQPPLYYALSAPVYSLAEAMQPQYGVSIRAVQLLSVFLSLLTLGVCLWISTMLFSMQQRTERLLFVAFFAVFSGVVLQSVRVNNDILMQLLGFTAAALCLHFWQSGRARSWYLLVLVLGLGILTKVNILLLLPVAFLTLVFQRSHTPRTKLIMGSIGLCILLSLTEWLYILRMFQDFNIDLVGNVGNLNGDLSIPNSLSAYLTFNPLQILHHPYNDAFGDEARRMFFPEYLYRSAFFGEFNLGDSLRTFSRWMLLMGFFVSILAMCGFFSALRRSYRQALPVWFAFCALLFGHAFFRFLYPYSSSQDFRYSVLLLVPVSYFALLQVSRSRGRLRQILLWFLWIFVSCCAVYTITLSILNPL